MCHCRPEVRTPCCGPQCCKLPDGCPFCNGIASQRRPTTPPAATNKRLPYPAYTKVRLALYNAKLALESGLGGDDKATTIRNIIDALDATSNLSDV